MNENYSDVVDTLKRNYSELVSKHGDGPEAVQQRDVSTQERRMESLLQVGDIHKAKILDFGCGTGHFLSVIEKLHGFEGEYVGYDITPGLIDVAKKKFPESRFEVRNIFEEGVPEDFDYVFISGVFNNRVGENWGWMTDALEILFQRTNKGLAFNNLTTYVDYFDDGLFYVDPCDVFNFCKEVLSPLVTLKHDYCVKENVVPFEFSTFVYRTDIPSVSKRQP